MASAKDIIITAPAPPTPDDTLPEDVPGDVLNAIFRELRGLMEACGNNKHHKVDVLITALIDRGINIGPRIIGWTKQLGYDGGHAGIRLSKGIGHRWSRDEDGTYRNLM